MEELIRRRNKKKKNDTRNKEKSGFNEHGININGLDKDGYNINGADEYGLNKDGFNINSIKGPRKKYPKSIEKSIGHIMMSFIMISMDLMKTD